MGDRLHPVAFRSDMIDVKLPQRGFKSLGAGRSGEIEERRLRCRKRGGDQFGKALAGAGSRSERGEAEIARRTGRRLADAETGVFLMAFQIGPELGQRPNGFGTGQGDRAMRLFER
ncbi:hypothetical protein D3C87_1836770 [compost metagenome]